MRQHREELVLHPAGLFRRGAQPHLFGDVARDLRCPDHAPSRVPTGDTVSEMLMGRAVLALPDGLEVLDREPGADAPQHFRLLIQPVLGNDDGDRLADHLVGGIAEDPLGAAVPGLDDAVEILTDDGVAGRRHDCGEPQGFTLETIRLVLRGR